VVFQSQQPNSDDGYRRLLAVLTRHGVSRVGIEGSGAYGWPAAIYLLEYGRRDLHRVPEAIGEPPPRRAPERFGRDRFPAG
jgi:hypothetical protein